MGLSSFILTLFFLFLMLQTPSFSSNVLGTSSIIFTGPFAVDLNKFINCAFFPVVVESHVSIYFLKNYVNICKTYVNICKHTKMSAINVILLVI